MQLLTQFTPTKKQLLFWQRAIESNSHLAIFSHPLYQQIWWKHLGRGELQILEIQGESGEIIGLAPFIKSPQGQLALIGTLEESDYLDVITQPGKEAAVLSAVLDRLEPKEWSELFLACLKHTSPTLKLLPPLVEQRGWRVVQEKQTVCPVITLPSSYEEYLARLEPSFAKQLLKQRRSIIAEGDVEVRVGTNSTIAEDVTTFISLHKQSGPDKSNFWTPAREAFFQELGIAAQSAGHLKLYTLTIDADPAAALWIFDYYNEFLLYNSGFNAYRYGHLGVGNYLVTETIREAIELGRSRYDFMRGDEAYKFKFGAVAEPLYNVLITRN